MSSTKMSFKSWHSLLPTPEADILLCVGLPAILTRRVAAHLNAIRVTNQPGENAIAERAIACRFVPSNIRRSSFGRLGLKTKKAFRSTKPWRVPADTVPFAAAECTHSREVQ
jgi:hypothetical protein